MRGTKTKITTLVVTLVGSCSLLYALGANLAYPREFQGRVEHVSFEISAALPVEFLDLSREFDARMEGIRVATLTAVPNERSILSHGRDPDSAAGANFEKPVSASTQSSASPAGPRHADLDQASAVASSPGPAVISSASLSNAVLATVPRRLDANVDRISFDTPTLAPMAFMRFCMRYPDDCKVTKMTFRPKPVVLTEGRRNELLQVTREVNHAIRPQANLNGVMAEEWSVSPPEGDCNDYAVTKRHELLARGWPSRSLLLAEVVVASGEHHLILVVRTREEDLVLDNLNWNVRPVSQIRYQWVRVQQADNPRFWSTAGVVRATRVAMNTR